MLAQKLLCMNELLRTRKKVCVNRKKKSKFKAFKSFFGKKKKKESKDAQGRRRLKRSLSSSSIDIFSLKSVQEGQQTKPGAKNRMGTRALSHDSIFVFEPDPERSERKLYPSPEIPRGRPLQRSHVFITLPRAEIGSMHEAVFGTVPRGTARSEFCVAGSKTTESAFEPSSGLVRSQSLITFAMPSLSSSTQLPVGFNTPATTQSCLDSSAARHEMGLNPQKQKSIQAPQPHHQIDGLACSLQYITQRPETSNLNEVLPEKPKQEEPSLPVASEEEKSTTKPKEADQKKLKKDSAGASSQEQSNKTEIAKQKTMDQATNTAAPESQSYPFPAAYMKRREKRSSSTSGTSECGYKERSFKQFTGVLGLSDGAGSPPDDNNARDCHFWQLSLEKQVMEQPTPPQTESTTQELPSGKDDPGRGIAEADSETRKALASQLKPEDMEEPVVGGLSPSHEDGTSGAKKPEARAALLHVAGRPFTPQDTLLVAVDDQMFMEPSQSQPEREEAFGFDVRSAQFKMKSAQETFKEKHPRGVLQALTARISRSVSALVEGALCSRKPPPRSLSWSFGKKSKATTVFSDSESISKEGSDFEQHQAPTPSLQSLSKSKDGQEVFTKSGSLGQMSGSNEPLTPTCASRAVGEPEDKVSMGSNSYVEKYNSANNTKEEMYPGPPVQVMGPPNQAVGSSAQAVANPKDSLVSKTIPEVQDASVMISAGVLPLRHPSQASVKPAAQQESSACRESPDVEKTTPVHLLTFPRPPQAMVRPSVEDQDSMGAESTVVEKSISTKPLLPKHHSQPPMRALAQQQISVTYSEAEQSVFADLEGSVAQKIILVEKLLPKYSPQSLTNPRAQKTLENTTVDEGSFVEVPPLQLSVKSKFQPQGIPLESMSAPTEWSGLGVPVPPRPTIQQSWEIPMFEQPASEDPESAAIEWGIIIKPLPPRGTSQAPMTAGVKQQISLSFESAAAKVGISGRPLPPIYPSRVLKKSKVLEMSSRLESMADKEVIPKKSVIVKRPSQSFVKYMAQHVFSERPATEEGTCMNPSSSNPPSKSLKPKVEQQVSSGWESTDVEGAISLKEAPMKSLLPSSGKPKGLQEVFSHSESAPAKPSSFKRQLPPRHFAHTSRKPEYQQETSSASESSLEEWKSSEEWLPGKHPSQVKDGAEFQPLMLSKGPVSAPVKQSDSEQHLPPKQTFQAPADFEHQQQVYPSPVSAAAEETTLESYPSCWSLPRNLASPRKIKKPSQSSEDLTKNVTTAPTKPMLAAAPALQSPTSGSSSSQEEVPESDDQNSSRSDSSNSGADVEKLFGVRLRRTSSSQKYKGGKQGFTKLSSPSLGSISSSVGTAQPVRRASKGALGTRQNLTTVYDLAEKQQRRPKSESMAKKQPAYRIAGKAPGRWSEYAASEPAWITTIKQEQGRFRANIPPKEPRLKSRAAAKAEMKEPRYGRTGLVSESQPRMVLTSDVKRQEKMAPTKPPKSTKTVGFEDEKILQVTWMEKETRSYTLPAMLPQPVEPAEPVWFSLAKKKAEAWSIIAETMQ
ncbi:hypothetical protein FD754_020562 [Muntiacus muntjak]|uniref:DUF4592 domain-containing protein n=1 Tax=Muntiacus muntjak TaxID=9888 RepID=A0A5N3V396_MUNMU|nr:hypothetical protein FD754_020562 [Muntiacus muntjak]